MTILQVSEDYKIPLKEIKERAKYLNIRGLYKGKKTEYSEEEVVQIVKYDLKNHKNEGILQNSTKKFAVMEYFFKYNSYAKVTRILNLQKDMARRVVEEYNKNDECIIVKSKMNE